MVLAIHINTIQVDAAWASRSMPNNYLQILPKAKIFTCEILLDQKNRKSKICKDKKFNSEIFG